jgi:hypothetical protein
LSIKDTSPFAIGKSDFNRKIPYTPRHVAENQFPKLKFAKPGKGTIQIANMLSEDAGQNKTYLQSDSFFRIFNSSGRQDLPPFLVDLVYHILHTKKEIFMLFHEMSQDILKQLARIASENV